MIEYNDLLHKLVSSEARKHYFERYGPDIVLKSQLERYNEYKSQLETHPDRMPRAMELEIILKIIDEKMSAKSYALCPSCNNNKGEELTVAYGKKWLAEHYPHLAGSVAQEKELVGFFFELSHEVYARLESALRDYNPVICQKVNIRLNDEPLYICPHFEKDKYHKAAVQAAVMTDERDRETLTEMRRNYRAELEKLSGKPPARRIK